MVEKCRRSYRKRHLLIGLWLILTPGSLGAQPQKTIDSEIRTYSFQDPLPFRQAPVDYFSPSATDRMSRVLKRLNDESNPLSLEPDRSISGYLRPLLKLLQIPVESQLLVYSKTALNQRLVNPSNPRAIYFNDDTYVGWVPGAAKIEIVSLDPRKGGMYYTLEQPASVDQSDAVAGTNQTPRVAPKIQRESSCLTCHASSRTFRVPGVLVQSYVTDANGKPKHGYSHVEPSRPYKDRFGGWYVTGADSFENSFEHSGNRIEQDGRTVSLVGNKDDVPALPFPTDRYPVSTSDVAAHLVLQHQVRVHNLLIRVIHESAFRRPSDALNRLCRELLFVDELKLPAGIQRTEFARRFQMPRFVSEDSDRTGEVLQTLRTLDLTTRLFRYRISYVVSSDFFNTIDVSVRTKIFDRLWELIHDDVQHNFTAEERAAVIGLIRKHVANLPSAWRVDP